MFKANGMYYSLGPLKGSSNLVVSGYKIINSFSHLARRDKTGTSENLSPENTEPTLDLVNPRHEWGCSENGHWDDG